MILLAAALLGGCAHQFAPLRSVPLPALELQQTPFFPQQRYQCGPAALATVLVDSGVQTTPEALVDAVWIAGRQGSLQPELLATTRRAGRLPVLLEPSAEALANTLEAGYPVLVLLNLGPAWWPIWHYAVVVGIDRRGWLLRSGTERLRSMSRKAFDRAWRGADRWGMMVAHPDHVPSAATLEAWVRAADDLAAIGQPQAAERALAAATRRWPDQSLAWFAYGNQRAALDAWPDAAQALAKAVALRPDWLAAVNNLVTAWLALDCPDRAQPFIPRLEAASEDYAAMTVREFRSHQPAGGCPYAPVPASP